MFRKRRSVEMLVYLQENILAQEPPHAKIMIPGKVTVDSGCCPRQIALVTGQYTNPDLPVNVATV